MHRRRRRASGPKGKRCNESASSFPTSIGLLSGTCDRGQRCHPRWRHLKLDGVTIRIVGIDASESYRSRCENELVLGLKAKERLRALIDSGDVTYERTGVDRC